MAEGINLQVSPGGRRAKNGPESWPRNDELAQLMPEDPSGEACGRAAERLAKQYKGSEELCYTLGSDPAEGLGGKDDTNTRIEMYGGNWFKERRLKTYLELIWDALHDHVIILLIVMATISLIVSLAFSIECEPEPPCDEDRRLLRGLETLDPVPGSLGARMLATDADWMTPEMKEKMDLLHALPEWLESLAIYISVFIIINVQAASDYKKERMFQALSKTLEKSNKKSVLRDGVVLEIPDREIVVGDVVQFNSHNQSVVSADGVLITGHDVKVDESSLTGEPDPIAKDPHEVPFLFAGTVVNAGSGKMLVVSVGESSVGGRIKMAVYGEDDEDEGKTPLFEKLDKLAANIGKGGTAAALLCFAAMCITGFSGIRCKKVDGREVVTYIITAITVLAVAVPEGLPLAVTLSLAFSSSRMFDLQNLVKSLDSCETMGSATTICTDKTGTLTANRMTVRGLCVGTQMYPSAKPAHGSTTVAKAVKDDGNITAEVVEMVAKMFAICSMDESRVDTAKSGIPVFKGNPTECALLQLGLDLGHNFLTIRSNTPGRSEATLDQGHVRMFSSARKMMSWAVPLEDGQLRIYVKGASEVVLERVTTVLTPAGEVEEMTDETRAWLNADVIGHYAHEAMRTICCAYKDVDEGFDFDAESDGQLNADGSLAFLSETELTLMCVTGIEDPLREEVPPAIAKCYGAGIDVRMVTGDNLETAIAIARRANILDPSRHFQPSKGGGLELLPDRAMEGKEFRSRVHRKNEQTGESEFDQQAFDKIWPYLRVLARSSPDDKLTLANGLNKSPLYTDNARCNELLAEGITIFPDRQVVAMTGDGTNDAPALKRADVGFAMGISGTQIAKDAADIILLDDNFASIVVAAKWGRNVYDSISKFLQFQLTVNIVALTLACIGACAFAESPIAAVQMLWINLIMDSLASLALATEPPGEDLLERQPVNRNASLITEQMWSNMLGQALYQVAILLAIVFAPGLVPVEPNEASVGPGHKEPCGLPSPHFTFVFNAFVMCTLFNEINSRKLQGEFDTFKGIFNNPWFLSIWIVTMGLQILIVQVGSTPFRVVDGGLTGRQWGYSILIGLGTLLWQQVINIAVKTRKNMRGDLTKRGSKRMAGGSATGGSGNLKGLVQGHTSGELHSTLSSGNVRRSLSYDKGAMPGEKLSVGGKAVR
jgi:Ca2+ transporting ATPase